MTPKASKPTAAKKRQMAQVVATLEELYPTAECALLWGGNDPWRLLVMARLSAQCTDRRVNLVAPALFDRFPTVRHMAEAEYEEVEPYIRSCGLFRTKARDLVESARELLTRHGGEVPSDMDALLGLSGVGRKIAHLIRGDVFGLPAVVTDTHCIRICGRLGFYPEKEKTPHKIEKILTDLLDPAKSSDFCHRIVWFGRDRCDAKSPACEGCPMAEKGLCRHVKHQARS